MSQTREFNALAALLAWVWPGLGHIKLGLRRRGFLIMFGVLFLFLAGVLVGGVDVVDRQEQGLWFIAQVGCGPITLAADFLTQSVVKGLDPERLLRATSIGRVNEMGTLFVALAGLMNVVVMLDALERGPAKAADRRRSESEGRS